MSNLISNVFSAKFTYSGKVVEENSRSINNLNGVKGELSEIISSCKKMAEEFNNAIDNYKFKEKSDGASKETTEYLKYFKECDKFFAKHISKLESELLKIEKYSSRYACEESGFKFKMENGKSLGFFNKLRLTNQTQKYNNFFEKNKQNRDYMKKNLNAHEKYSEEQPEKYGNMLKKRETNEDKLGDATLSENSVVSRTTEVGGSGEIKALKNSV